MAEATAEMLLWVSAARVEDAGNGHRHHRTEPIQWTSLTAAGERNHTSHTGLTRYRSASPARTSAGENPTLDAERGKIPLSRRKTRPAKLNPAPLSVDPGQMQSMRHRGDLPSRRQQIFHARVLKPTPPVVGGG